MEAQLRVSVQSCPASSLAHVFRQLRGKSKRDGFPAPFLPAGSASTTWPNYLSVCRAGNPTDSKTQSQAHLGDRSIGHSSLLWAPMPAEPRQQLLPLAGGSFFWPHPPSHGLVAAGRKITHRGCCQGPWCCWRCSQRKSESCEWFPVKFVSRVPCLHSVQKSLPESAAWTHLS